MANLEKYILNVLNCTPMAAIAKINKSIDCLEKLSLLKMQKS